VPPASPVWLLTVEAGGESVHVATRAVAITSEEDGAARAYAPGLGDLAVPVDADSVTVAIDLPDADAWRWRTGPWVGRLAVLRLWSPGDATVEAALVILRGVVVAASWDDPASPRRATLSIERAVADLSATVLPTHAAVDRGAWPDATDRAIGAAAPVILGRPGATTPIGWFGWETYAASPAIYVDFGTLSGRPLAKVLYLAPHHVAAATVRVYDLTDGATTFSSVENVVNTEDVNGNPVALTGVSIVASPGNNEELFAAWGDDGALGGVLLDDEEVRGLGSALLWGARYRGGRNVYDLGRMAAERATLDAWNLDAVVNDPAIRWEAWLAQGALASYLVDRVEGPRGAYYRAAATRPDPLRCRAVLTTRRDVGGRLVARTSAYTDEELDVPGVVVRVWYAQHGEDRWPRRVEYRPTAGTDARQLAHPLCRRARELYAAAVPDAELPVREVWAHTADVATAWAIARRHVERYAVPHVLVEVEGPASLARDLEPHDTVELVDTDPTTGAAVRRWATVEPGALVSERSCRVPLRLAPEW